MKHRNLLHVGTALVVISLALSLLKIGEEVQVILIAIGGASMVSFLGFWASSGREERLKVVRIYLNASLTLLVVGTVLVSVGSAQSILFGPNSVRGILWFFGTLVYFSGMIGIVVFIAKLGRKQISPC